MTQVKVFSYLVEVNLSNWEKRFALITAGDKPAMASLVEKVRSAVAINLPQGVSIVDTALVPLADTNICARIYPHLDPEKDVRSQVDAIPMLGFEQPPFKWNEARFTLQYQRIVQVLREMRAIDSTQKSLQKDFSQYA